MYILKILTFLIIKHTSLRFVLMSYPAMAAVPEVIERSPVRILKVVVFPAPNLS